MSNVSDLSNEQQFLKPAIALIKKYEGFSAKPYLCPAGVWTIGYGNTKYLDGRKVQKTDPAISEQAAEQLLELTVLKEFLPKALSLSPLLKDHPNKLAAVLSFCYNLGAGAYANSTLRKKINASQFEQASKEFGKWVMASGKKLNGLVKRRAEEQAVFVR